MAQDAIRTAKKIMPHRERLQALALPRWLWLTFAALAANVVLLHLFLVPSLGHASVSLTAIQLLLGGALLGIGRQGIGVLAGRVFLTSMAISVAIEISSHHAVSCTGIRGCAPWLFGVIAFVPIMASILLLAIALPVTVAWSKGTRQLRSERGLVAPRTRVQWLILWVCSLYIGLIAALGCLVAIMSWPP